MLNYEAYIQQEFPGWHGPTIIGVKKDGEVVKLARLVRSALPDRPSKNRAQSGAVSAPVF